MTQQHGQFTTFFVRVFYNKQPIPAIQKTHPPLGRSVAPTSATSENWSYIFPSCWTTFNLPVGIQYNDDPHHAAAYHPTAAPSLQISQSSRHGEPPECRCLRWCKMQSEKSACMVSSSDTHGIQCALLTNDHPQIFDQLFGKVQLTPPFCINN